MRKILAILMITAMIFTSFSIISYADESDLSVQSAKVILKKGVNENDVDLYFEASGKLQKGYENSKVVFTILKSGIDLNDSSIPAQDKIIAIYQNYVKKDLTFDISKKVSFNDDKIVIAITVDKLKGKYINEVDIPSSHNVTKLNDTLHKLSDNSANVGDVTESLKLNSKYLTSQSIIYDNLSESGKTKVSEYVIENKNIKNIDDLRKEFDNATLRASVLYANNVSDVKKSAEVFNNLIKLEDNPLYSEIKSYEKQDECYSYIMGKEYKNANEINKGIADGFVISKFKNANAGNIRELTLKYKEYIGVDEIKGSSSEISAIEKNIYKNLAKVNSMEDLKNIINDAKKNAKPIKPVTPGGAGGGGGGGSHDVKVDDSALIDTPADNITTGLKDIGKDFWGYEAITTLYNMGIVSGKGDNYFYPSDNIKRSEFIVIICNAYDLKDSKDNIDFKDVNSSDWYYKYVKTAFNNNIISGNDNKEFNPDENITREDASIIIKRTLELKGKNLVNKESEFIDKDSISDYAKEAINLLSANGFIKGFSDNTFKPKNNLTRAESAQLIYNIIK